MHYFKRNIGDYHKKAGRLSMLEHGAYTLLMDACYDRERFPTMEQALDWCWARSDGEIAAVKFVLEKFFILDGEQYMQQRVADEISAYHEKSSKNKQIALDREASRRALRERIEHETCTDHHLTINQEPLTINQEPEDQKPLSPSGDENTVKKITYSAIQAAYNKICPPVFPACAVMNEKRKRQIKAMCDIVFLDGKPFTQGIEVWEQYFTDCLTNPHWCGQNDRNWRADFDFVTTPKNAIKLMEMMN